MLNSCRWFVAPLLACAFAQVAWGYGSSGRWPATAIDTSTGSFGDAATLTWSIVPDGTPITLLEGVPQSSNLVQFLDRTWGAGPGGNDLTQRPWFSLVEAAFSRWDELGGVQFVYQPHDNGVPVEPRPATLGQQGDIRLSGATIDGPLGTLATNKLPSSGGDMVIDTLDGNYFGDPRSDHRRFRNLLMHELGHGLGLAHTTSKDANFLMEPSADTSIDGPQSDDILGLHHLYGDRFESVQSGRGNDTPADAVPLGPLGHGISLTLGMDAFGGTRVASDQTDFVSISNARDEDYFSFRIDRPSRIDLLLQPLGATYQNNGNGAWETQAVSDLRLRLLDADGQSIATANDQPAGLAEIGRGVPLAQPGEYVVGVTGDSHLAQFYALHLAARPLVTRAGDYNGDGVVDLADLTVWRDGLVAIESRSFDDGTAAAEADSSGYLLWKENYNAGYRSVVPGDFDNDGRRTLADYTVWRDSLGSVGLDLAADADGNHYVDQADYVAWRSLATGGSPPVALIGPAARQVPEPSAGLLLAAMAAAPIVVLARGRSAISTLGPPSAAGQRVQ